MISIYDKLIIDQFILYLFHKEEFRIVKIEDKLVKALKESKDSIEIRNNLVNKSRRYKLVKRDSKSC